MNKMCRFLLLLIMHQPCVQSYYDINLKSTNGDIAVNEHEYTTQSEDGRITRIYEKNTVDRGSGDLTEGLLHGRIIENSLSRNTRSVHKDGTRGRRQEDDHYLAQKGARTSESNNIGDGEDEFNDTSWTKMQALIAQKFTAGYDPLVRPVFQQTDPMNVYITFYLNAMINFDTAGQKMDLVGYFVVEWKDEILKWEGGEFDDVDNVNFPLRGIWYPKLIIDKAYGQDGVIGDFKNDIVKIHRDGTVRWTPNGFYSILCNVDARYYPFDAQNCNMEIYVSDHTKSKVSLTSSNRTGGVVLFEYSGSVEWELIGVSAFETVKYDTHFVIIQIQIERMASFTVYTMVIPLFTLSILSIMTYLASFESGEKIGLAMTVFLAYGFFAVITRGSIPPDSIKTPYLVMYISAMMICNLVTVLYIMIESKIYFACGTQPCQFGRSLSMLSSRLACLNCTARTKPAGRVDRAKGGEKSKLDKIRDHKKKGIAKRSEDKTRCEETNTASCTWSDCLRQLDWLLFILNFVVLFLLNIVVWVKILNRV